MFGKKVVVGCVVCTRLAFRLVELVLFKVGCVVFLRMFLEKIERVTAPIVPIALLQVVLVHILLDVGFIGAYFLATLTVIVPLSSSSPIGAYNSFSFKRV